MSKNLFVSLIVFFCLVAFVLFFERFTPSTDQLIKQKNSVLTIPVQDLEKISSKNVTISCAKNSYYIHAPFKLLADSKKCSDFFTRLANLKAITVIDNNQKNLDYYGLKENYLELILFFNDKKKVLHIGRETKDANLKECYARLKGEDKIFVINSSFRDALLQDKYFYLEKQPFSFTATADMYLEWTKKDDEKIVVTKEDELCFVADKDFYWPAKQSKIDQLISVLSEINLMQDDQLNINCTQKLLDDELVKVLLKGKKGSTFYEREFALGLFGGDKENYYLTFKNGKVSFPVQKELIEFFLQNQFETIHSKAMFAGPVKKLKGVEFVSFEQKQKLKFVGDKMNWQLVHPYKWLFSSGKIFNYLLKYVIEEVDQIDKKQLLGELVFSVFFDYESKEGKIFRTDIFKEEETNFLFVRHNNKPYFAKAKPGLERKLLTDPFVLVSKKPFINILNKAVSFTVKDINKSLIVFEKNSLGNWHLIKNTGKYEIKEKSFIEKLKESRCYNSMEAKDGVDFGFEKPVWTFDFKDEQGKLFFQILVGSFSSYEETFARADNKIFMLFKEFFLFRLKKRLK